MSGPHREWKLVEARANVTDAAGDVHGYCAPQGLIHNQRSQILGER
jgi:hypothetical protein